ncbi:hypothetical protein HMPREF0293_2239 [Corynebacterium glucuronolyticum ATCC 51866]|uniref:Uncharacterized protein n=1 Tax=Corynebacterium glucuronolyticum ATCC 51866 TaxID=548478 RepID=A0ABM9XLV0_9CORY|nr:hypothetical protein HMPREF0293_2239 [Corynebacterium glucuronolyticum ATCC 51866]
MQSRNPLVETKGRYTTTPDLTGVLLASGPTQLLEPCRIAGNFQFLFV